MNEYFVNEKLDKIWLVCKYVDGLNYPLWKMHMAPEYKPKHFVPSASLAEVEAFISWPGFNEPTALSANKATDKESPQLWHQRLGHIRMKDLHKLMTNDMIDGITISAKSVAKHDSTKCQTCIMAKRRRSKLTKPRTPSDKPLHTCHSDIQGPFHCTTIAGGKYMVSLVDEATTHGDVSVTKTKDAAVDELRRMILVWEAKTQKKCCVLFTDRGGEYANHRLKEWCLAKSIDHQFSVPRTPEQNGRAERFNQTITNICRALLFYYKLKDSLWGHAMIYACMIYNIMINKKLGMTRYEAFHGVVPNVANYRTFGCKVYGHVPHTARKKLEPKYQLGIFLGPETEGPGYKVLTYNDKLKRDKYQVRIFRDIVTYESLPKVTGVQDESQLHWGGQIDLPEGEDVPEAQPDLEPLTGVPDPQVSQETHGVVDERQLALLMPGSEERVFELDLVDGPAHNPAHPAPQDVVSDPEVAMQQPNTPCDVGGDGRPQRQNVVSSQSPTQQGAKVPSAVDTVVHDPVTPIRNDKAVPTETSVPDKSVAKSQRDARALARADGQPPAVDRQRSTDSGPPLGQPPAVDRQRSTDSGPPLGRPPVHPVVREPVPAPPKRKLVAKRMVKIPDAAVPDSAPPKKVHFELPGEGRILRSRAKSPPPPPPTTKKQKATPKPVGVPLPAPKPVGVPIPTVKPVGVSNTPAPTVGTPLPTAPVTKSILRTSGAIRPRRTSTPLSSVLPSAKINGILRHGVGFLATSCGVELPRGFTFVTPTAFSVQAPFDPPDLGAYDIKGLEKVDLVTGLMRHFNIEPAKTGPIPVIGDPTKIPIPNTLKKAMATPYAKQWAEATVEEWLSLVGNNTWTLVEKKPLMKVIPCKWVYTIKTDGKGKFDRFKARLVAGGHRQTEGVDYNETYAPVTKNATVRTLLAVAAHRAWDVQQIDIKTAFLHGKMDTEVHMLQPPGFVDGVENVVRVDKSMYGFKQAPRIWYELLNETLQKLGFVPMSADSSFWVKEDKYNTVYLTSVVDDMLVTSDDPVLTKSVIDQILKVFPGTKGGRAHYYNGFKITWLDAQHAVILSQPKHIQAMVDKFCLLENLSKEHLVPVEGGTRLCRLGIVNQGESPLLDTTIYKYRELIGGLSYVACGCRPDICFIVNQLARYANAPRVAHWDLAIRVLRYLKGTINWGISLGQGSTFGDITVHCEPENDPKVKNLKRKTPGSEPDVIAYADANHGTSVDDKRSISGVILQVYGGPVMWSSKVQPVTALSTCESEFRAMSTAARDALWLKKVVALFRVEHMHFVIRGDNQGAIHAVTNYTHTKHTKHIEIHLDFMRDYFQNGDINFVHIDGKANPADMLTKAVSKTQFETFRLVIGMRPVLESMD
jgi:hypothetical protein